MEKITHHSSFEELKNSLTPAESSSAESTQRHERFAEAMKFFRSEYIQSRVSSDRDASAGINPTDELH